MAVALSACAESSVPNNGRSPSPVPSAAKCPTAAEVFSDFVAAFNSGDRVRIRRLLAPSFHLADDLPERFFKSQQDDEVRAYLDARINLGEQFLNVKLEPGITPNVVGITFLRTTSDGRKLYGKGKAVTSQQQAPTTDCSHLSELIMFGRPEQTP